MEDVQNAKRRQVTTRQVAEDATARRDVLFQEVKDEMRTFYGMGRVGLVKYGQLAELIDVTA